MVKENSTNFNFIKIYIAAKHVSFFLPVQNKHNSILSIL